MMHFSIRLSAVAIFMVLYQLLGAQDGYWQQRIYCQMEIDFDVETHRYTGVQKLVYTNHSPDTLDRIYYHLYFNAFQPGSEMFEWTSRLPDPDARILRKLSAMKPEEQGYMGVRSLTHNGHSVLWKANRTILEVYLDQPLAPGMSAVLDMVFEGQVPLQTRRSGRYNDEGIAYSMAQWFPKVCNYDRRGWHAHPYVQREFYGVWGDYDVTIHIDRRFVLGGTGYLQNPQEVGAGYEDPGQPLRIPEGPKKTWHFFAPNVHDFVWAADPAYKHTRRVMHDGTEFHFLYVETPENRDAWAALPALMDTALYHINRRYGPYPYRQYAIIQGGDGGMEYPMATLITGNRPLRSLVGVSVHELMHMWYQMILGFNESAYSWMDEGFTSYASSEIMGLLFPREEPVAQHRGSYLGYLGLARSGVEEPLTTHADHFLSNYAYGAAAYSKGAVFLHQLGYIIGQEALDATLLRFYHTWKFKHPTSLDFIRIAEKESGLELDWYHDFWVGTTRKIDYAVDTAWMREGQLHIRLRQAGTLPMPVDVAIKDADGRVLRYTIPLDIMRGFKRKDRYFPLDFAAPDWAWTNAAYTLVVPGPWSKGTVTIALDPTRRLADVDQDNNVFTLDLEE